MSPAGFAQSCQCLVAGNHNAAEDDADGAAHRRSQEGDELNASDGFAIHQFRFLHLITYPLGLLSVLPLEAHRHCAECPL